MKFYRCRICGNLVEVIDASGQPMSCCGSYMTELKPSEVDASKEKHVPVIKECRGKVTVTIGSEEHPMSTDHFIEWIVIETRKGSQRVNLDPTDKPRAEFHLAPDDQLIAAYAYCNKHGLWMTKA